MRFLIKLTDRLFWCFAWAAHLPMLGVLWLLGKALHQPEVFRRQLRLLVRGPRMAG